MELAVGAVVALVVLVLLFTLLGRRKNQSARTSSLKPMAGRQNSGRSEERASLIGPRVLKPCPLCGAGLAKGQTVKTKVIEIVSASARGAPKGVKENRAEVYGCPYCWPASKEHPRTCPSCHQILGNSDIVFARYFERTEGKNHLHVLGCTICRKF